MLCMFFPSPYNIKITVFKIKQTSVRYNSREAEGPRKNESRDGPRLLSPSFAQSKQTALNFSTVVLSEKKT